MDTTPHAPLHNARYRRILRFAAGLLVRLWWYDLVLPRIGLADLAERSRARRLQNSAVRFHALAVQLGGLMIKVGQFLSSRLDVLPPEVTQELAALQDEVPPVPFPAIRAEAQAALGADLDRVFASFDEQPVAAASLGQVHRATLSDADAADTGFRDVVVKVQRPGIEQIIATDLAALRRVAGWLRRIRLVADRVDADALVEEFARTSLEEVDYLHEAANAARFAQCFEADPRVGTPDIAWERSTRRVLTLADVTAIKINDIDALRAAGIDPAEVAAVFASVMFEQVFTHGFFHADPHPGNIFVTPLSGADASDRPWRLTFIDFGMMGEVPAELRDGLRALIIAVAARDSARLVEAVQQIGVLLPSADTAEFERAVAKLFNRFGGMGFKELQAVDPKEFRDFALEFGQTIRSLPFQLPEGLLLLFRAVGLTSGMCSALDPDFNVWDAVEPYAATLMREESGGVAAALAREAWTTAGVSWRLPQRIDSVITRIESGRLTVDLARIERRVGHIERLAARIISTVVFAALLLAGAVLMRATPPLAITLMVASAIPLVHMIVLTFLRPPR